MFDMEEWQMVEWISFWYLVFDLGKPMDKCIDDICASWFEAKGA